MPEKKFILLSYKFLNKTGFSNVELMYDKLSHNIFGSATIELGVLSYQFEILINRSDKVSVSTITDFRKRMNDYTNKGLLISTGDFSRDIKRESRRKKEIPIDLINGIDLVNRIKNLKLGVGINERNDPVVDRDWFNALINQE